MLRTYSSVADIEGDLACHSVPAGPVDIPDGIYHRIRGAINASALPNMDLSASKFRYKRQFPDDDKPAFEIGKAIHCAILEPERFRATYISQPKFDRRTKDGKAAAERWQAMHEGKMPLTYGDWELVDRVTTRVNGDQWFRKFLRGGLAEASWFAYDKEFEIWRRCRTDYWLHEGIVIDIKTTGKLAHPASFSRSIRDYHYLPRAAFYMDTIEMCTGVRPKAFALIAIEKHGDHDMSAIYFTEEQLVLGTAKYRKWLRDYIECRDKDSWPGYERKFHQYEMKSWELKAYEDLINEER